MDASTKPEMVANKSAEEVERLKERVTSHEQTVAANTAHDAKRTEIEAAFGGF